MQRTALILALLLFALPAGAQVRPAIHHEVRLAYVAPGSCPGEQVLRDLIAGQTSTNVFAPDAQDRLTVTLSRRGPRYEATAELRDPHNVILWTRPFLPAPSCAGLVEDVAVYVSAKLEPRADDQPPAPTASPPNPAEASPEPPQVRRSPVPVDPVLLLLGLGSTLGLGVAPRVAAGLSADVGVRWSIEAPAIGGFSLSLGFLWFPPAAARVFVPEAPDARASTTRLLVTVAPCGHWWKLYGCALGELGRIHGGGEDITIPRTFSAVYAAAGGRAGIEVPFAPHVGFRGFGEVLGGITAATIFINNRSVYTTPRLSGGVGAGVYVFF